MAQQQVFEKIASVSTFRLPPIPCSFPHELHPSHAYIEEEANRWMGIEEMKNSRLGLFIPLAFPRVEGDDGMILASRHTFLFFLFDDMLESSLEGDEEHVAAIKSKVMGLALGTHKEEDNRNSKYVQVWNAFEDMMSTMRATWRRKLFSRYLHCLSEYVDCVSKEAQAAKDGIIMDEAVYRLVRRNTIYVEGATSLFFEFCMGLNFTDEVTASPIFKGLVNSMADHMGLMNDLMSFRKEYSQRCSHNWVCVLLCHGKGIDNLQEAIDRLCEMIHEEELTFLHYQQLLLKKAREDEDKGLLLFAEEMAFALSGNHHWGYITGRYHGRNNPLMTGEHFHGTFLMDPYATIVS